MHIPRLLLLALWILLSVSSVAAQSSIDKSPVSSQPQLDGLVAPPEFRTHVLPLAPNVRAKIRSIQPQASLDATLAENNEDCLFMRTYRVVRDHPGSDTTRPAGYSECQPAARFQMKSAVESREIVVR